MKKLLFTLALAASFGLVACSDKNDAPDGPSDGAIRFAATIQAPNPSTRDYQYGTEITSANLDQFLVSAYIANPDSTTTGKPYMNNVTVNKGTDNAWSYSPVQYWPDAPLNFYALAPLDGWTPDRSNVNMLSPLKYHNYTAQYDLLYATIMNASQPATPGTDAQVRFNFRHALAKTQVNIRTTQQSQLSIAVGLVTFNNIASSGTFTLPTQSTSVSPNPLPNAVGTWSAQGDLQRYPAHFPQMPSEIILLNSQYQNINPPLAEYGGASYVGTYMIPQNISYNQTSPTSGAYMEIHLAIYDYSTHALVWPNHNTPDDMKGDPKDPYDSYMGVLRFPLSQGAVQAWQGGNLYIYNITIDPAQLLGQIDFGQPTVDGYLQVETAY